MQSVNELNDLFTGSGVLEDLVPGFKYVWESKKYRRVKELTKELLDVYIGKKLEEHKKTFDKGSIIFLLYNALFIYTKSRLLTFESIEKFEIMTGN